MRLPPRLIRFKHLKGEGGDEDSRAEYCRVSWVVGPNLRQRGEDRDRPPRVVITLRVSVVAQGSRRHTRPVALPDADVASYVHDLSPLGGLLSSTKLASTRLSISTGGIVMRMGLVPFGFLLGLLLGLLLLTLLTFDWGTVAKPWIWIKTAETNIQTIVNAEQLDPGKKGFSLGYSAGSE